MLALFRDGRTELSVAEVAIRAGVHASTIYRRWPTPSDLLREALTAHTDKLQVPDTGHWETDLLGLARELATFFSDPVEKNMNCVMASGRNSSLTDVLVEHWTPLFSEMGTLVMKAIDRGEIPAGTNASLVMELLVAPLLMRTIMFDGEMSDDFVHELAESVRRSVG